MVLPGLPSLWWPHGLGGLACGGASGGGGGGNTITWDADAADASDATAEHVGSLGPPLASANVVTAGGGTGVGPLVEGGCAGGAIVTVVGRDDEEPKADCSSTASC